jgi:hypothetical protein
MIEYVNTVPVINKPPRKGSRREAIASVASLLFLILLACVAIYRERPPEAVAASAPSEDFSAERAMDSLKVIASAPRPLGSPRQAAVRDYILEELARLGLQGEVQPATSLALIRGNYVAGTINNIIAKLRGTANGKAILLAAHYDSVPGGNGASDDGSGVAVLLETLRALKSSPPLKNDVIFLFSDGEEEGLLGARAFIEEHPAAKEVGLALNFEARGVSGPSIMFETSDNNGWLIDEFARRAPYPVANSLTNELYKLLPNDTDLSVFKKAGLPGLNFAFIENSVAYHTQMDDLQNISQQSLQHQGSYALALVRSFGDQDLTNPKKGEVVYFALLKALVIHYPTWLARPLAILLLLLFGGLLLVGLKTGRLTWRGIAYGLLGFILSLGIVLFVIGLLWRGLLALKGNDDLAASGLIYSSNLFIIAFIAIVLAIMLALYSRFRRRRSMNDLVTGALCLWVVLSLATSFLLPGASYLFTWPSLFMVIALGFLLAKRGSPGPAKEKIILSIAAAPAVLLLAPVIQMVFVALTLRSYAVVIIMAGLLIGLIVPHLSLTFPAGKWATPLIAAALGLTLVVIGLSRSSFGTDRRKPDNLSYFLDADAAKASWLSSDQRGDAYTAQYFGGMVESVDGSEYFPALRKKALKSDAPLAALRPPDVAAISKQSSGEGRALTVQITSPRKAPCIWIVLEDRSQLSKALINDKAMNIAEVGSPSTGPFTIGYYGVGEKGIQLTLITKNSTPIKIMVMDSSYGSFELPGVSTPPRPNDMMASGYPNSDWTIVRKSFAF